MTAVQDAPREQLRPALVADPGDPDGIRRLVVASLEAGRYGAAARAGGWWLATVPSDRQALTRVADAFTAAKRPAEALRFLERALDLGPDDLAIWERVMAALFRSGNVVGLSEMTNKALARRRDHWPAWYYRWRLMIATDEPDRLSREIGTIGGRLRPTTDDDTRLFRETREPPGTADLTDQQLRDCHRTYARICEAFDRHAADGWIRIYARFATDRPSIPLDALRDAGDRHIPVVGLWQGEWRVAPIYIRGEATACNPFKAQKLDDLATATSVPVNRWVALGYFVPTIRGMIDRYGVTSEPAQRQLRSLLRPGPLAAPRYGFSDAEGQVWETNYLHVTMVERLLFIRETLAELAARGDIDRDHGLTVIEIGGGYGELAHKLLQAGVADRIVLVDLPPNLLIGLRIFSALWPGEVGLVLDEADLPLCDRRIVLMAPWMIEKAGLRFDLALNFISFQHFADHSLRYYLDRLAAADTPVILHENYVVAKAPDAVDVRDYPFHPGYERRRWWLRSAHPVAVVREVRCRPRQG